MAEQVDIVEVIPKESAGTELAVPAGKGLTADENVLAGGIETLHELKEDLLELEGYRQRCKELDAEDIRLEKLIDSKAQAAEAEFAALVKRRRQELASSFAAEMTTAKNRMKKLKAKKDKLKNAKVSERIDIETAELREEKKAERTEIRSIYRKEPINRLFNNRLFYSFFLPGNVGDVLIAFAVILILLAIPCGIYYLVLPERKVWMLILLYVAVIAVFGGIYAMILAGIKTRHEEAFRRIRTIRAGIRRIEKEERRIAKSIYKDRDESGYGLEKYDDQLKELQARIDELAEQEKQALKDFDGKTRTALKAEVMGRYEKELTELAENHEQVETAQSAADKQAREFAVEITRRFEPFMGKDMMNLQAVDALIAIVEEGRASTISGAVLLYRQENPSKASGKKGKS